MNLLLISSGEFLKNGTFVIEQMKMFEKSGHRVFTIFPYYNGDEPGISGVYKNRKSVFRKIRRKAISLFHLIFTKPLLNNRYYMQGIYESMTFYNTNKILQKMPFTPDIIIIYFAVDFINAKNISELRKKTGARVYILMMDMAPLTGGCHYAWDCTGYQKDCKNCPGILSKHGKSLPYRNLKFKLKYLNDNGIKLIAASEWQLNQASLSSLYRGKEVYKILTAFDHSLFSPPENKEIAKQRININSSTRVILFASVGIDEERKGLAYLIKALNFFPPDKLQNYTALIIGTKNSEIKLPEGIHVKEAGYVDFEDLPMYFQAADVYACPSIEDSGPNTINMSILCGVPVVCFEMGIAPDLVIQNQTGYAAKLKDSNDLYIGLNSILEKSQHDYSVMSDLCREIGLAKCSLQVNLNSWNKLFYNEN
jgi:glycosyltransferase involved in cell wall biosynthesis